MEDGNKVYETEEALDNNIFLYTTERVFRMRIVDAIKDVLEFLHANGIFSALLERNLLDFASSSISFGGDFILKYPLKYVRNNNINRGQGDGASTYSVRQEEAERIWIDRYCKYLQTMKNIELPLVGNVVWANLYDYAEKLVGENPEKYQCKKKHQDVIKNTMAEILLVYLEKNLGCVVEDYERFLKKESKEKFDNFKVENLFPEYYKDIYKRTVWKNNHSFENHFIKDRELCGQDEKAELLKQIKPLVRRLDAQYVRSNSTLSVDNFNKICKLEGFFYCIQIINGKPMRYKLKKQNQ